MSPAIDRVGVMVVRVWIEEPSGSFRARLTRTLDVNDSDQSTHVASTREEILAIVSEWLDVFCAEHDRG
jgi:hypothetical protein